MGTVVFVNYAHATANITGLAGMTRRMPIDRPDTVAGFETRRSADRHRHRTPFGDHFSDTGYRFVSRPCPLMSAGSLTCRGRHIDSLRAAQLQVQADGQGGDGLLM